jgi:hypothetical protein
MEIRLLDVDSQLIDNVSLEVKCGVQCYVHTASKYDECQLLAIPSVDVMVGFNFRCLGDSSPHDHHRVVRCHVDRLPACPEGQVHDSYRLFRSHGLNISLSFIIHRLENMQPELMLYASTIRWLQKFVDILRAHVARPIKRGSVHNNVRPKRLRFTRHINSIDIKLNITDIMILYWSSVKKQDGVECNINKAFFQLSYKLHLIPFTDGLVRRPKPDWRLSSCQGKLEGIRGCTCVKKGPMDIVSWHGDHVTVM